MSEKLFPFKWFETNARRYVQQLETQELEWRAAIMEHWQHRAEGCGCLQCKGQYAMRRFDWAWERWRMYQPGEDQEETWITNWILNNRLDTGKRE